MVSSKFSSIGGNRPTPAACFSYPVAPGSPTPPPPPPDLRTFIVDPVFAVSLQGNDYSLQVKYWNPDLPIGIPITLTNNSVNFVQTDFTPVNEDAFTGLYRMFCGAPPSTYFTTWIADDGVTTPMPFETSVQID